jgi:hypothetical protein
VPASIIAALDSALKRAGQDITLRRIYGTQFQQNVDLPVRAFVRTPTADELLGGFTQNDSIIILSPTSINREGWPGGELSTTAIPNPSLPRPGDKVIILSSGKTKNIESPVNTLYVDNVLVRIELKARGS